MKGKLTLAIILLMLISGVAAVAKPADPRPKTFLQPDGQTVTVKLRGDERHHFYLTQDDYLLVRKGDAFYYGNLTDDGQMLSSGILASDVAGRNAAEREYLAGIDRQRMFAILNEQAQRSLTRRQSLRTATNDDDTRGLGLFPKANFPVTGHQKVLIILVQYADIKFSLKDPYDYFSRLLSEPGFSDYGGTGSVADFFRDNSLGQFEPEFVLYGPITLMHNRAYYGGNDWWGNDERPERMVIEACQKLDDEVDFSEFDRNGDGFIDNVYLYYAGTGEASGGGSDTVWPHSWFVTSATDQPYVFDGVQLDAYGCSNEWERGEPDGIGTFVHEFSHVMGLPDLYCTNYNGSFTPGAWSALDYGPYNNDGRTPPNYGAFERYALGWMTPNELTGPYNVMLPEIINNQAYVVNTSDPNEFFLCENRQNNGWDTYIPGHGMLIWHIDFDGDIWDSNTVNNNSSHQRVDIIEADNSRDEWSRSGDSFPGDNNVTSFTATTRPAFQTWRGEPIDLPFTEISEDDGVISFLVAGGVFEVYPVELAEATEITFTTFVIGWTRDPGASNYLVSVYTKADDGTPHYVKGWQSREVGNVTSVTVTDLQPATTYYCVVVACNHLFESDESNEVCINTPVAGFDFYAVEAEEPTEIAAKSFTANWSAMKDATSYMLDVYSKDDLICQNDTCDFTGGLAKLPAGWETNSRTVYSNAEFCGENIPALRFAANNLYIASPIYDAPIHSLSFWYRGSNVPAENKMEVSAWVDDEYVRVAVLPIHNDEGGEMVTINDLPANTTRVKVQYLQNNRSGSMAIDDIVVCWNPITPIITFDTYNKKDVGDVTSYQIDGLEPLTTYYYKVIATDGEKLSRASREVSVTTLEATGVSDVAIDCRVAISAGAVEYRGMADTDIAVYDITGRRVASAKADASGNARIILPSPGLYILRAGGVTYKLKN